jgi:hypothetical protein
MANKKTNIQLRKNLAPPSHHRPVKVQQTEYARVCQNPRPKLRPNSRLAVKSTALARKLSDGTYIAPARRTPANPTRFVQAKVVDIEQAVVLPASVSIAAKAPK